MTVKAFWPLVYNKVHLFSSCRGPGSMEKAVELFQKAISLSRTESEMAHLFSLSDAAKAQLNVGKKLGINLPGLGAMSS